MRFNKWIEEISSVHNFQKLCRIFINLEQWKFPLLRTKLFMTITLFVKVLPLQEEEDFLSLFLLLS